MNSRLLCFMMGLLGILSTIPQSEAAERSCESLTPSDYHGRPFDPPPVQENLTLMGRGVQLRRSDEKIALACLDESCTRVRFVHFQDRENAVWIGHEIEFLELQDPELQRKANDLMVKKYLLNRRVVSEGFLSGAFAGSAYLVLGWTLPVLFSGANEWVLLAVAVSPILVYQVGRLFVGSLESNVVSQNLVYASRDQNGWNWSQNPELIGKKRFDRYYNNICNRLVDYSSPDGHFGANPDKVVKGYERAFRKITRKLERLKARDAK